MLAECSKTALHQAQENIADFAAYQDSHGLATTLKELFPEQAIALDTQLKSCGETASTTMLTSLLSMRRLIGHRNPNSLATTAQQSVSLPWRMVMVSINRMLIMRHNTGNGNGAG